MVRSKFVIKRFDGDDECSWAVFYRKDVKKKGSQIFYGQAKPVVSGCSKNEAQFYKKKFEREDIPD